MGISGKGEGAWRGGPAGTSGQRSCWVVCGMCMLRYSVSLKRLNNPSEQFNTGGGGGRAHWEQSTPSRLDYSGL